MDWADSFRKLGVRTNADTPADTKNAVKLGAEGIGLCRTEHMFFDPERIHNLRRMIVSDTVEAREEALSKLLPYQKGDFKAMYKALEGRPMTVRYLDPPLHEFTPKTEEEMADLAKDMGITVDEVKKKCDELHEFNPMMGHRGCRLAVTYPELAKMQTRAVMEAAIEVQEEEGYEIEAVQNKGYCLKDVPDVLGESEIKSRLHTRWAGQTLYYYDEIDSTNTQIKRLAEEDAPHGPLAVADYQSIGEGRRGRAWDSPHGSAIYMSILFRPEIRPDRASMLTLVIGLSVTQAIRSNLGLQAQIKWPNDVVLNGKKLVGILTEMSAQMNYIEYLVTGIGINANLREFPEELEDKATSLQKEIGHKVNRSALIAECMEKIEENYEIFVKTQDLSGLMAAYQEALVNQDQQVRVLEPGHEYTGVARGINAMGELLVEKEDGTITEVYAGEVSVRGLYGYV